MNAKTLALVFGVILVLAGLLGFVTNPLFGATGYFMTNHPHDLVHLVSGLILLGVALWATPQSLMWLKILGVVYLILAILGFLLVPAGGNLLGLFATNMADHWLHVVFGVVLVAAGYWGTDSSMGSMPPPMPRAAM